MAVLWRSSAGRASCMLALAAMCLRAYMMVCSSRPFATASAGILSLLLRLKLPLMLMSVMFPSTDSPSLRDREYTVLALLMITDRPPISVASAASETTTQKTTTYTQGLLASCQHPQHTSLSSALRGVHTVQRRRCNDDAKAHSHSFLPQQKPITSIHRRQSITYSIGRLKPAHGAVVTLFDVTASQGSLP
eukprot:scaffold4501_cov395-Prasinococcus_capsulatus_cf.AAC.8